MQYIYDKYLEELMSLPFRTGQKILFIGDSITDAGRTNELPPYGGGYMNMFKNMVIAKNPDLNLDFINKGICGNTIKGLQLRWQQDVIFEKPDHLFIMIGINDAAVQLETKRNFENTLNDFENNYIRLLNLCIENKISSITCLTPFYISNAISSPLLDLTLKYIKVIEDICFQLSIPVINIHEVFQKLLQTSSADFWSIDGIHPSVPGRVMIAEAIYEILDVKE
jgi:lysophospholipase L1-like esterase